MTRTRARGSDFSEADFTDAELVEVEAGRAVFNAAIFDQTTITRCDFQEADFRGARLKARDMADSILTGAQFKKPKAKKGEVPAEEHDEPAE